MANTIGPSPMGSLLGLGSSLSEETTSQFLDRREKELRAQISALRGQLAPKEVELDQIVRMKAAANPASGLSITELLGTSALPVGMLATPTRSTFDEIQTNISRIIGGPPISPYAAMTIKECVIQALLDHFPNGGTAADIRDFIRDAYQRTFDPSSVRPQMHRLKANQVLEHDPSTDTWNLTKRARALYGMYDHPTSRRAMKELQDDPPDEK